ncbi:hypothetical protein C5167_021915 [Papaver somniferum]|uniref:Uncharacterized protein n=1 Tax=Papaver somniferum TaxID=3469 RepID=A0A4Y7JJL6_PAPSO|nr:hypothetical protein C5167_021915 [Papaver somniferum]
MWRKGVPTSTVIQRIIFWQHKTIQMMYEIIYKALEDVDPDGVRHPTNRQRENGMASTSHVAAVTGGGDEKKAANMTRFCPNQ